MHCIKDTEFWTIAFMNLDIISCTVTVRTEVNGPTLLYFTFTAISVYGRDSKE